MQRFSFRAPSFMKSLQTHKETILKNIEVYQNKFEERIKGKIVENWVKYWKTVFTDYKDVVVDVRKDVQQRPLKAICICTIFGSLIYCAKHNPNEQHFRDAYLTCANQVLMVNPSLQNPNTTKHLLFIEQTYNKRAVRRLSLGFASIIWIDKHSDRLKRYDATCPYLQSKYSQFIDQVLDIGFLNRWWILNRKMVDYDINY